MLILFQALQGDKYAKKFQEVTEQIERALSRLSYDTFDIPEEVKEQVLGKKELFNH